MFLRRPQSPCSWIDDCAAFDATFEPEETAQCSAGKEMPSDVAYLFYKKARPF